MSSITTGGCNANVLDFTTGEDDASSSIGTAVYSYEESAHDDCSDAASEGADEYEIFESDHVILDVAFDVPKAVQETGAQGSDGSSNHVPAENSPSATADFDDRSNAQLSSMPVAVLGAEANEYHLVSDVKDDNESSSSIISAVRKQQWHPRRVEAASRSSVMTGSSWTQVVAGGTNNARQAEAAIQEPGPISGSSLTHNTDNTSFPIKQF